VVLDEVVLVPDADDSRLEDSSDQTSRNMEKEAQNSDLFSFRKRHSFSAVSFNSQ
jgi:hypothetical protein